MPPGNDDFTNGISIGARVVAARSADATTIAATCCCTKGRTSSWSSFLGGCGPGWYMEGTAELFGTHRLDEQLPASSRYGIMPHSREEVPMLAASS